IDGEHPMMRRERFEIVIELNRRGAAQAVHQHQWWAAATAEVVKIYPVERDGLALERGERLGHALSLSVTPLRRAGRDRSDEPEIGEHADPDEAEQQQDHPGDLTERLRVGQAAGSGEPGDADHDVDQVVQEVDLENSQQRVDEKTEDPGDEINGTED